ncbi:hypothetical protein EDB81DRAFT_109554 [Dactylonectria macrodidyma]|uniref:Kelch repeat-containing protein n=1 Tax=Dactylonectria macrodidyma TaxID=307937 RepID=A0A9P9EA72_9HYPO|nr:hypothetical protein EDB81DRAFT_109554 [Dactylonectria macrodidyma]
MTAVKSSSSVDTGLTVPSFHPLGRPRFNSQLTSDRIREASFVCPPFKMGGCIKKGRRSVFKEIGLENDIQYLSPSITPAVSNKPRHVSFMTSDKENDTTPAESEPESQDHQGRESDEDEKPILETTTPDRHLHDSQQSALPVRRWYSKLSSSKGRPRIKSTSGAPPGTISGLQRFTLLAMLIAIVLPTFGWHNGRASVEISGADAELLTVRDKSPVDVCARWAFQAALLNGTLYMYGGRSKLEESQVNDTWNNYFVTLDVTSDWDIASPAFEALEQPDGPPAISMGYLWHDYKNLYLYGGQFSDSPFVEPGPESVWKYSIADSKWTELEDPKTSAGNESEPADVAVHRAAEGAGLSVPELGLSWFFGGHLDWSTTPGWSQNIDRVYLKSLLEFTHPGYVNSGVEKLSTGTGAGEQGAFRNITQGGIQAGKFPERADGVLVFIPGWGEMGVLIGLAGGTADNFTDDLTTLDVYDIANSEWFHQQTSGDAPSVRVNPCAVVASAPDASSFQIYMFGGQDLPFGNQTQYNDMYILTIPSFTWIKVDQNDQDTPSPRAGHSCVMYDGQILTVGGTSKDMKCDNPGVYVFDASVLQWKDKFSAAAHKADWHADNAVLAGSYGYIVPSAVQEVIGGNQEGGATATTPAAGPATGGPFATGRPPVFTITQSGSTATITSNLEQTGSTSSEDEDSSGDTSPGLITAGVVAGIAGALALYLGFCAWLYRRQVRAYKHHLAVTNRYSGASSALFDDRYSSSHNNNRPPSAQSFFGWVGSDPGTQSLTEPKWRGDDFDNPSGGSSSGHGFARPSDDTRRPGTSGSGGSAEGLLEGHEPSFFNVVLGPRRALRVVNGVE